MAWQWPAERSHAVDNGLEESSSVTLAQSTDGSLVASVPTLPSRIVVVPCCCCCFTPGNGADDEIESKGATEPRSDGRRPTVMVALGLLSEAVTFLSTSTPVVEVVVVVIVFEVVVKLVIVVLQPVAAAVDVDVVVVDVD